MGLNFVYDTPLPQERLGGSKTAMETYLRFLISEIKAVGDCELGQVMKTALGNALQARMEPVLAALETLARMTQPTPQASALGAGQTPTIGALSSSSSSMSRSDG